MPTIVQTSQSKVTGLWGKVSMMRGADGRMHALKLGDLVHRGDVILTTQDGIVRLTEDETGATQTVTATLDATRPATDASLPPQTPADLDLDRVIAGLNDPNSADATAAGVTGGDGAGDLTPGLRVDRIAEPVTLASLALPAAEAITRPDPRGPAGLAAQTQAFEQQQPVPRPSVAADSSTVSATEEGAAVGLGLDAPTGITAAAVITVTQLPTLGVLQKADGTPVTAGAVLTTAELIGLKYLPPADYDGSSPVGRFGYSVADQGRTATGGTTIALAPVNDAPVGNPDTVTTPEDTPVSGNVLANDRDVDSPVLTVTQYTVAGASHAAGTTTSLAGIGTLLIAGDGSYTFTPAADYNGPVPPITYTLSDGALTATATLSIAVSPVNDPPNAAPDLASTPINTAVTIPVLANDTDKEGDPITVTGATLADPARGTVVVNPDGTVTFTPAANTAGPVAITYTVSDGHGGTGSATVTVNVGTNTPPTGADSTHTTLEDTPYVVRTADFGFTDADAGQTLANVRIDALPAAGTLLLGGAAVTAGDVVSAADIASGKLVFVPAANGNGAAYASFIFSVQDSAGAFDAAPNRLTFDVTPIDDAPMAAADTAAGFEDTPITGNVLANDTDVDNPRLAVTQFAIGGTTYAAGATAALAGIGTLTIGTDGTYTFTPAANYNGPVPAATYTATDGTLTASATLTLAVTAVNDPPVAAPDLASTPINTPITIAVLANDTDVERDPLTVATAVLADPTQGTVTINPNGTLAFTPAANLSGTVVITYTVSDGHGGTGTSTVTVNVGNNTPPNGADSTHTTLEDTPYVVRTADFGFTDADAGQTLANVRIDTLPATGTLTLGGVSVTAGDAVSAADIASGKLVFVPAANGNGAAYAGFTFSVQDSAGAFDAAPNTLTFDVTPVNDAPVANPDSAITLEDTPATGNVLANDTDVDVGTTLQLTQFVIGGTTYLAGSTATLSGIGTLFIGTDGAYTFTPAANYNGTVPVATYTATDGTLTSTSTLTLTITPVNDAPVANADVASTPINTPLTGIAVLANDTDVDANPLTVTSAALANPALGSVSINPDGTLAFTPASNVSGPVTINYTIADGQGGTAAATLTVNVGANTPPTGADSTHTTLEDTPYVVRTADFGFADADAGQTLANVRIDTLPAAGMLLLGGVSVTTGDVISAAEIASGRLVFTPATNANGTAYASFTFSVQDTAGAFDAAPNRLTLDVTPVNDAPVANPDSATTFEDTPATGNVLANDTDVDAGTTLQVTQFVIAGTTYLAGSTATLAGVGTLFIGTDGSYTFTPAADYNGSVPVATYTVSDGTLTSTSTLTLAITAVNDAPIANPDSAITFEDTPATGNVLANDTDVDAGTTLQVTQFVIGGTTYLAGSTATLSGIGTLFIGTDGAYTFTPAANYNGTVPVATYTATDGTLTSTSTLTLTITPVNDAPVANADVASTPINTPLTGIAVLANDTDVDANPLTVTSAALANPALGSVSINPDGTLAFTPASNVSGPVTINYTIADGQGGTAAATLTINVGANTPPTGADATVTIPEDTSKTFGPADFGFADADAGQTFANVRIDTLPVAGSLTLNGVAVAPGQVIATADLAGLVFTPAANANGTGYASFTFSVRDSAGAFDAAPNTIGFNVTPVNDAPVANPDSATTFEDTPATGNVLANDTDVDAGTTLRVTQFVIGGTTYLAGSTAPLAGVGTLTIGNDGAYTFTPAANYNGPVPVAAYTVSDGALTSTSTLSLTVTAVNDPPVLSLDANQSHNTVVSQSIGGLFNTGQSNAGAALADGTPDSHYTLISAPAGSTLTPTATSLSYAWIPNDATSTWIGSTGNQPTGVYQYQTSFTLQAGADPASVSIGFDLASDNNLRDILVNGVSTGFSSNVQYGAFTHIDLHGVTSAFGGGLNTITFVVDNRDPGSPGSSGPTGLRIDNITGSVAVIVPDGVTHLGDYATTYVEGTPVSIGDIDTRIQDVDSPTLQSATIRLTNPQAGDLLQLGTLPAGITASINAAGTVITFTGAASQANYEAAIKTVQFNNTTDTPPEAVDRVVTVVVNDGFANSNTATTTIHVVPVNDVPRLDLDGNDSTAAGTGYAGTYLENAAPVSVVDADVTITDTDSTTLRSATIHIANLQAGDVLTVGALPAGITAAVYDPASGVLTLSGAGTLADYQAALRSVGFSNTGDQPSPVTRNIEISVNDGIGNSQIAVSHIAVVPVNDAPAGTDATLVTNEDTPYVLHAADFGFSDPLDTPANTLAAVIVNPSSAGRLTLGGVAITAPTSVTAAQLAGDQLAFAPAANANGNGYASFTFQVKDNGGTSSGGVDTDPSPNTITFDVTPVADPAVIGGQASGATVEDTTLTSTGTLTVVDPDAGQAAFVAQSNVVGAHGSFSLNAAGNWRYTLNNADPAVQALGQGQTLPSEMFTVRSIDGTAASVTVSITGTNDAPVAAPDTAAAAEAGGVANGTAGVSPTGNVLGNDTDVDTGDTKAVSAVAFGATPGTLGTALAGAYGSLVLKADGSYTYSVNDNAAAVQGLRTTTDTLTDTFTYTVKDAAGALASTTLAVTISGANDAPVAAPDSRSLNENATLTASAATSVLLNDTDVDTGDTKAVSAFAFGATAGTLGSALVGAYGTLTMSADGTYSYSANRPAADQLGTNQLASDVFSYTVKDTAGLVSTTTLTFNITGTNDAPVANADTGSVLAGATLAQTAANGVILSGNAPAGRDTDIDTGDTLTVVQAVVGNGTPATAVSSAGTTFAGTYGDLLLKADGSYSYVANRADTVVTGTNVTDLFTYQVSDGHGGTSNATLAIGVGGQADTVAAPAPTSVALTSTLGLNGEYYGYNDYNPTGNDTSRRHGDDGTVGNLDRAADFNALVNLRNATQGGPGNILGTTTAALANTSDATFLARAIDYGTAPTVTNSLGSNVNLAAGGAITALNDTNSSLFKFLDRTGASDAGSLVIHTGTDDGADTAGKGPTSGLGTTSDAGVRLTGEAFFEAGVYDIRVTADDGYRLNLGGQTVALFDNIQAPTTRVYTGIGLDSGPTALELLYWEQGGNAVLKVEYKLNGAADTTYQLLGSNSVPVFADVNAPTLADNQHLVAGSTAGTWLVQSGSVLDGAVGNDSLTGSTGSDLLKGGVGNDTLAGGAGDDVLIGGKGNDALTGGAGHDTFRWSLGDGGTVGNPARDTVTDFNNAPYAGDKLDLRDLLVGEDHVFNTVSGGGATAGTNALTTNSDAGNLGNFLHFSTNAGGGTVLEISSTGGFSAGFNAGAVDQVITISGVNLTAGFANDNAIIADLFQRGKLVTDGH